MALGCKRMIWSARPPNPAFHGAYPFPNCLPLGTSPGPQRAATTALYDRLANPSDVADPEAGAPAMWEMGRRGERSSVRQCPSFHPPRAFLSPLPFRRPVAGGPAGLPRLRWRRGRRKHPRRPVPAVIRRLLPMGQRRRVGRRRGKCGAGAGRGGAAGAVRAARPAPGGVGRGAGTGGGHAPLAPWAIFPGWGLNRKMVR